tara:strand:+ start:301 stop:627 length:327 start_codon:yes stop_codon:yes gene_type:complete
MTLKLSITTKETHHIDWLTYSHVSDRGEVGLDELIAEVYGKSFEIGSDNDSDYAFAVKDEPIGEYDIATLNEIVKSGYIEDYQLDLIMTDLCRKGVIAAGNYVVTVSW